MYSAVLICPALAHPQYLVVVNSMIDVIASNIDNLEINSSFQCITMHLAAFINSAKKSSGWPHSTVADLFLFDTGIGCLALHNGM